MDERLRTEIEETVRRVVQDELNKFRESEIEPIKRQLADLDGRLDHDIELPPVHKSLQSPFASQRSSPSLKSIVSIPNGGILHRVGSKVASTTSSLLHGSFDGDSTGRDCSPFPSPLSLAADSGFVYSTSNSVKNGGFTHGNGSGGNGPAITNEVEGPVTVRRNSGLSRAMDKSNESLNDLVIPRSLQDGLPFLRVTHNKKVQRVLRIDKDSGVVSWNTKQSSRLYIDRICEIYIGEEARNYREEFRISSEHSQRWATIIHQRPNDTKLKALHLIISSQQDFDVFIASLFKLVKFRREIMSGLALAGQHFVDVQWTLNSTSSECLSFSQVLRLSRQLHIHCSRHYIRAMFDEADKDGSHYLDFDEFREFVRLLKFRADIQDIYDHYRIGENTANLVNFFSNVQHETLPSSVQLPLSKCPSVEEFSQMLMSSLRTPAGSQDLEGLDLSLPLNNYFICSSHNTYLMGRQVADGSSIESCIRALQDGCRCLELDCWDGPANSSASPVIYHGHGLTRLTTSVVFSDVIDAILKYAFISTPFPLVLSLEIRCNESSQLRIASILRTVLAGLLVTEPLPGDDGISLPSPSQLKHRILIKVKSSSQNGSSSNDDGSIQDGPSPESPAAKQTSITPALAELGVYFSGKRFPGGFSGNETRNTVYSFSERTFKGIARDTKKSASLEYYNKDHFTRVYPGSYRLTSSNFDPIYFWKHGVQMVALNWQTFDLGMQINMAFFSSRIGYVLKPKSMRSSKVLTGSETGSLDSAEESDIAEPRRLEITIVSAQQLPRPKYMKENSPFSPYVILEAFGIGSDDAANIAQQWKSPAVFDNGFNPIWNYKCIIHIPPKDFEFVCLRFTLAVEGQPFAYHMTRIANMRPGYRHVPLVDLYGEDFIFSSLFIKTELIPV